MAKKTNWIRRLGNGSTGLDKSRKKMYDMLVDRAIAQWQSASFTRAPMIVKEIVEIIDSRLNPFREMLILVSYSLIDLGEK